MGFYWGLIDQVFSFEIVARYCRRSTGPVDRCAQDTCTDQHRRPVDRAVDRLKSTHSQVPPVDWAVDRQVVSGRLGDRLEAQRSEI